MTIFLSLVLTLFIVSVISYISYRWKRRRFYELASKIPGPEGLPLLGEIPNFATVNFKDYAKKLLSYADPNSTLIKGWFGPLLMIITEDADCIHTLFNSPNSMTKPWYFYNAIYMDQGLLVTNGEQYDRHRKILNKSFTPSMLQIFIPTFCNKSQICIDHLEKHLDGIPIDIYDYVGTCTLEVFCFGHLNYDRDFYGSHMIELIEKTRPLVMKKMFSPWYNFKPLYKLTSISRQMEQYYQVLVDIIEEVKQIHRVSPNTDMKDTVINVLMNSKYKFDDDEIRDEIATFIFAGYETTAIALASIFLMLAMHKDCQQKLIDEIDEILTSDDEITNEDLSKFTYTDMVIKESLRLFGPGGAIGRQTTDEMEVGGYTVPKGACFILSVYGMHRSPKYWGNDAHLFKPERFEPERIKNVNPHAYAPFSGGKRICPGFKYSIMFMKIFLAKFFKTYTVDTKLKYEDISLEMTPTMVIAQKYMVTLKKR
ncbi:hypothetical protein PVAND_013593 [Polypedilum vanderplanki]|uniref:Cytochrome P450 n=1 Tax=Polypedilum vanderplanki TaxID=319348 RepID=A0A9J6CRV7_POLVA|nr:hypothetical protein PVAND_013593 [Polypedilum vanderplanki]